VTTASDFNHPKSALPHQDDLPAAFRTNGAVPVAQGEPAWRRTLVVDRFLFPVFRPIGTVHRVVPNRTVGAETKN
jgi:hypothetical protein